MNQSLKKRLLVVDDEDDTICIVKYALEDKFEVDEAHSGEEALEYLSKNKPDYALFDYEMPGMTGRDTIIRARQLEYDKGVEFHAWSGKYDDPQVRELHEKIDVPFHSKSERGNRLETINHLARQFGKPYRRM